MVAVQLEKIVISIQTCNRLTGLEINMDSHILSFILKMTTYVKLVQLAQKQEGLYIFLKIKVFLALKQLLITQ